MSGALPLTCGITEELMKPYSLACPWNTFPTDGVNPLHPFLPAYKSVAVLRLLYVDCVAPETCRLARRSRCKY